MDQYQQHQDYYRFAPRRRLLGDRSEAGEKLAERLSEYRDRKALVLALPHGGVPVADAIAQRIHGELDVLAVRKLASPGEHELSIGAVTADGTRYLDEELVRLLEITPEYLEDATERERKHAERCERTLREGRAPFSVEGRTVIVVDDGLTTGATMRAAILSLRRRRAKQVVVAIPVGASEICAGIDANADRFVCLFQDDPFYAVSMYYRSFENVSDQEAAAILQAHAAPPT